MTILFDSNLNINLYLINYYIDKNLPQHTYLLLCYNSRNIVPFPFFIYKYLELRFQNYSCCMTLHIANQNNKNKIIPKKELTKMLDSQQINTNINPEDFQHNIQRLYQEMIKYELTHDFVSAEHYKIKAAKEQKRYEDWSILEMNNRHNQLKNIMQKNYQEKLNNCNSHHQSEINQYQIACHQNIKNIENTNKKQINDLRKRLEEELPSKVKESTQLINLRRMQEHMNKQKNFIEAYRVQSRIKQLYDQELAIWNEDKNKKIDQAVINLKNKHQKERDLFQKRMQIHLEDMNNKWHVQKNHLHQIYSNQLKQLKSNQQREYLSFKRQFKTKGGLFWNKVQESSDND